jgi:hypothetical protein
MKEGEKGSEMKQMNANGREGDFVVADVVPLRHPFLLLIFLAHLSACTASSSLRQ